MTDKASIAIDLIETQCSVYANGKRYCVFCSKVCYPPGLEKHKNTCPIHIVSIVKTAAEARRKCNYAQIMEMACSGETMRLKAHEEYIRLLDIATDAEIAYAETVKDKP